MQTLKKSLIQFILLGLLLTIALGINYLYAWTGPGATPPAGNVPAPINVSTVPQVKDGNLGVGKSGNKAKDYPGLTVYGSQFTTGWLSVGGEVTAYPPFPLVVRGTTKTDRVYTSSVCANDGQKCKRIYPAATTGYNADLTGILAEDPEKMSALESAFKPSPFGAAMAVKSVIVGTTEKEWNDRVQWTYDKFKNGAPAHWLNWKNECWWDRKTERFPTDNNQLDKITDWVTRVTTRKELLSICGRGMCRYEFGGRSVSDTIHCGAPLESDGASTLGFGDGSNYFDGDAGDDGDTVLGLGCKGKPQHFNITCVY